MDGHLIKYEANVLYSLDRCLGFVYKGEGAFIMNLTLEGGRLLDTRRLFERGRIQF